MTPAARPSLATTIHRRVLAHLRGLLPAPLVDRAQRNRALLALRITLVLQTQGVVLAAVCLGFGKLALTGALLLAVGHGFLVPVLLRRSLALVAHSLAAVNLGCMAVVMGHVGRLAAPSLLWSLTSVIIAVMLGGRRIGLVWVGLVSAHAVLVVAVASAHGPSSPDLPLWLTRPVAVVTLGAVVYLAIAEFERAKDRAIAELEVSRAELDAVLQCTPALIATIGPDGLVRYVNRVGPTARRADMIGASWRTQVAPDDQPRVAAALRAVFTTGRHQTFELGLRGPGGEPRWLANRAGPLWAGGRIAGAIIVGSDITETRLAQAELATAQRLASVGTLAAGVAHEINTPLQFVSDSLQFLRDAAHDVFGLVERLQEVARLADDGAPTAAACAAAVAATRAVDLDYLHEQVPRAFARASDGLERVTTIVRSMRELAAPGPCDLVAADLNRAIGNTITIARNQYAHVADIETDFGELPPVRCHLDDLAQVVLNLMANAAQAIAEVVKGSERRGTIRVQTRRDGDWAALSISDTGGGIPVGVRDRVFEPFFTTKEVGRGTGQGLAIARALVTERHGGELTFSTTDGVGTTFHVRLPLVARPTAAAQA